MKPIHKIDHNPSFNPSLPPDPNAEISGIRLIEAGWKKGPNSTYIKDGKTIKYDGNHWVLNDKRITIIKDTWV